MRGDYEELVKEQQCNIIFISVPLLMIWNLLS